LSKTQTTFASGFRSMRLAPCHSQAVDGPKVSENHGSLFAAKSNWHSDLSRFVLNLLISRMAFVDKLIQRNQRQRLRLADGVEHQRVACIGVNPSRGVAGIGNHVGHLARCAGLGSVPAEGHVSRHRFEASSQYQRVFSPADRPVVFLLSASYSQQGPRSSAITRFGSQGSDHKVRITRFGRSVEAAAPARDYSGVRQVFLFPRGLSATAMNIVYTNRRIGETSSGN
jgi:hypothetical protein